MKKYILLFICTLALCSSCEDWFDVEPRTEIKEDNLFKNENGYFDALVGVYTIMGRQSLYGDQLTMSLLDGIIQNYYIISSAHPLYYIAQRDYTNTNLRPTIDAIWEDLYEAVANANNILEHLDNCNPNIFTGNNYNIIKGEALAQRAFLHFDLLRLFGPSFVMDKTRPCIPYVTLLSKENTPYSSPEEVVRLCLQDLGEAEKLLADDPIRDSNGNDSENIYLMNRTCRLNLYAVKALMARIYHYAGEKANALHYARELINNEDLQLTSNLTNVKSDRLFSQELLFALFVDNMADWVDDHFGTANSGYDYLQYEPFLDEVFEKNIGLGIDIRQTELFNNNNTVCKLNKYLMNSTDAYSSKYRIPMIRLSEAYYIAAENTDNLEEAEQWLNKVRAARGLENRPFTSFEDVKTYLTNEYRREFWGEGQAFFRYKWLNANQLTGYYTTISLEGIQEETYILPLPEQEEQYGGSTTENQ